MTNSSLPSPQPYVNPPAPYAPLDAMTLSAIIADCGLTACGLYTLLATAGPTLIQSVEHLLQRQPGGTDNVLERLLAVGVVEIRGPSLAAIAKRDTKMDHLPTPIRPGAVDLDRRFDLFWMHYPKKVGKAAARREWLKLSPSSQLTFQIVDAVDRYARTESWHKAGGRYIPHPQKFLGEARWLDDIAIFEPDHTYLTLLGSTNVQRLADALTARDPIFADDGRFVRTLLTDLAKDAPGLDADALRGACYRALEITRTALAKGTYANPLSLARRTFKETFREYGT